MHDIRHWAEGAPERVVLRFSDRDVTYAGLEAWANRLARLFARLGLTRGARVVVMLPNRPLMIATAWAAWRSGVYFTPVPTSLTEPEVAHIVEDSGASLVIGHARYAELLEAVRTSSSKERHWLSSEGAIAGFDPLEQQLENESTAPREDESPGSLMLYTSGTTGRPRGVFRPLPDASFEGTATFAADLITLFGITESARYLSTAPLYHAAPLRFTLAFTAAGGTVTVMDKFEASAALSLLIDHRITHSQWVPTMFQRMLQLPAEERAAHTPRELVMAIHAAAPCPVPVKRAMIAWWGPILVEYYAGSESVGLTRIDSAEWLARPGSVGRAVKGELHIVGEDGEDVAAGEVGRIYFGGTSKFEYLGDAEKTAARSHRKGYQTLGDIGYVDDAGYLFLTDRQDDMIISGGVNVYPQEIESALLERPEIIDCGVVGRPDDQFGERPIAFIVGAPGITGDALASLARAHCEARLGRVKQPDRYVVLAELPRSPTGKLLRRQLREA